MKSQSFRRIATALIFTFLGIVSVSTSLSAQYFGKNKMRYRDFDMAVIRTEHFDLYYDVNARDAAERVAVIAERSYAYESRVFHHQFKVRKPIVIYATHAEFQQTNTLEGFIDEGTGGVTEFTKKRVIVPLTGALSELEHVLTHEMVHAFQYDIMDRGLKAKVKPSKDLSLWFIEGSAEYFSLAGTDTHEHGWLRDAVMSGYVRNYEEVTYYNDYLSYRFGQAFWAYLGARFGDEAAGAFLVNGMTR